MDLPLFSEKGGTLIQHQGRAIYKMFDASTFCLRAQMRQQGAENSEFRHQLERLATGKFDINDWKNWSNRDISKMSLETKSDFIENGTMLCARKKDMTEFNAYHLRKTGHPIAKIKAVNSPGAYSFSTDSAQGLRNTIYLSKGAKIVLTSNLWSESKLVNGSHGIIRFIIYKGQKTPGKDLPDMVLVEFPSYIGPSFLQTHQKIVPIIPQTTTWYSKKEFSRTTYPLILSWSLTIHKAQGIFLSSKFNSI